MLGNNFIRNNSGTNKPHPSVTHHHSKDRMELFSRDRAHSYYSAQEDFENYGKYASFRPECQLW